MKYRSTGLCSEDRDHLQIERCWFFFFFFSTSSHVISSNFIFIHLKNTHFLILYCLKLLGGIMGQLGS